jgi:hypothetical protein
MLKLTNLIDFQNAKTPVCLDNRQVRVLHLFDVLASSAHTTGLTWYQRIGTIDCLGEAQCQCSPSDPLGTSEEIRMPQAIPADVLL